MTATIICGLVVFGLLATGVRVARTTDREDHR